jgi:hypothetical protein
MQSGLMSGVFVAISLDLIFPTRENALTGAQSHCKKCTRFAP